jgi:hypothetical protein
VTAGGVRSRGVAFGSPPKVLAPAAAENHDIALRLERHRWNGMVEPRVILRSLCPTPRGHLHVLGEEGTFWERLRRALERNGGFAEPPAGRSGGRVRPLVDRRREGFAGVAGDLFSSGEKVLVAVADVPRRREGLEAIVAGLAPEGMPVASWRAIEAEPGLATGFDHLLALDPPPGGRADALLRAGPCTHLAWGPGEAEFALLVWRAELDLRPVLVDTFRAVRTLAPGAPPDELERALSGSGRYPRGPEHCEAALRVLTELGLVELSLEPPACRVLPGARAQLEISPTYRACRRRLDTIEQALAPELPTAARKPAAQAA